jgi:CheY-like chemotaxis protein
VATEKPDADLAAAVHEATNALTVILGWIERAREASSEHPDAVDALRRAARYARTARNVMRRAIGAEIPAPPPDGADAVVQRTLDDLAVEAQRADVSLEHDLGPSHPAGAIDRPDLVWQILTNLLLNAIEVSPSGGAVRLELAIDADVARFRVRDRGPGVAPERRDSLFEGGTTRPGGAGIGLRHARTVAREHGGDLVLASNDGGACFELSWPLAGRSSAADLGRPQSERPAPSRDLLEGAEVLLLEDDAAVVELLELSLGARGARVTSVRTAAALDAELARRAFDVLLVDLSPLGAVGAGQEQRLDETLLTARRANPSIDVVVISGSITVQPRADVTWVRKPFEPRELVAVITRRRPPS